MTANKSDFATAGADKGANELRDLMGDVLRQIADTERQNATLLKSMQNRIETLNQGTKSVRAQAAVEHAPLFDRIDDGMSVIADRVAATSSSLSGHGGNHAAHQSGQQQGHKSANPNNDAFRGFSQVPAFSSAAHDDPFATDDLLGGFPDEQPIVAKPQARLSTNQAGHSATAQPRTTQNGNMGYANHVSGQPVREPQPLRSAAGHHHPLSSGYRGNIDPFDVVESLPGNPADPWSSEGAASLTDFYASGEPVFGGAAADDHYDNFVTQRPRADIRAAEAPAFVASAPAVANGVDKQWLESHLAEIATRLERTLSQRHAEPSLNQFDNRLAALEARMVEAIANGQQGYSPDPAHIGEIEAQIQALATEFDAARTEIARLKVIEDQLGALMRQFSDERMSAIVGRSLKTYAPAQTAIRDDNELQTIAVAAAEAAVARLASSGQGSIAAPGDDGETVKRVSDLHDLMLGFIDERRQGDEQNAQVMDALQQAMLRVLDRLDEIEGVAVEGYDEAQYYDDRQPEQETEPEYVPPQRDTRMPTLEQTAETDGQDTIARQRASLQASAQRAAVAQRDKQRDEPQRSVRNSQGGQAKSSTGRLMVSGLAICLVLGFATFMMRSQFDGPVEPDVAASAIEQSAQPASQGAAPTVATTQTASQSQAQNPAQSPAQSSAPATAGPPARPKAASIQPISKVPRVIMPETVSEVDGEGVLGGPGSEQVSIPLDSRPQFANFAAPLEGSDSNGGTQAAPYFGGLGIGGLGLSGSGQSVIEAAPQQVGPNGEQSASAGQSSALELPPATVGPLSMRIAAAKGDPSAEFEVATRLAEGKGTDQDFKEAHRWYQRSAAQGFAQALYRLATLHERGLGTKADVSRAKAMYQRAAEQGNVKSMHNLAVLAAGRSGGAPDYTTAATWFTQAANHGLADSQFNLAVLTESGLGVPKDMVQAAMWFILAAQGGDKEAVRRRDAMKGKIERSDWSAAENLARSWQPIAPDKLANDARYAGELWKSRQTAALPAAQ